jgi:hypothetical protein
VTTNTTTYSTISDPAPSNGTGPSSGTGPAAAPHPDGATRPDGPVLTRPLADFLPGGPAAHQLAVTLPSGDQVVVLRQANNGQVEVWSFGHVTRREADTVVYAVADSARRDGLLTQVVHGLAEQRRVAIDRAAEVAAERDAERDAHERVLSDIRAYAVDKHQDGTICRGGLNDFLTAFGLPEYEPRVRVYFTLTGSYDVDGEDADAARRDARGYLRPDLSALDNVVEDSDTFTVHVESVEELDT